MGKALNAGLWFLLGLILIFSAAESGHALELGARAY